LDTVRDIVRRLGIQGFYGPVYELFEIEEKYSTALEVTAGNRFK